MRNNRFSPSHFTNPFSSARFNTVAGLFTTRLRRLLLRQAICIALIFSLLFLPGSSYAFAQAPALAATLARVAVLPMGPLVSIIKKFFQFSVKAEETTADRTSRVTLIRIEPGKLVGYLNQRVSFSAVGKDSLENLVQGARFDWASSDETKLRIDDSGQATLLNSGLVWVTASTRFASSRVPVLIRPRARGPQTDDEWKADQDDLRPDGSTGTTGIGSLFDKLAPTVHAQTGGGDSGDMLYDELWSEPRNLVGSPRNRAMDGSRIGAVLPEGSNFEFSVPVVGLPGRGLPSGVSLNYNSRIWSRRSNKVTFNAVNSWPYLGFTLSFGRLVTYGSDPNTKFVFIDGDGTRHFLGTGPSYLDNTLQSNDGSHITYVGSAWGGAIHYNNGVTMYLNLANNRVLVSQIRDANGNYMTISYQNQSTPSSCNNGAGFAWKQAISSITDTLGRVITSTMITATT